MAVDEGLVLTPLPVSGIRLAACEAGVRYPNRKDLVVIAIDEVAACSAVFTRNVFCAAPVTVAKQHLVNYKHPAYLLINTGNANAGNGQQGIDDAIACCKALAEHGHVKTEQVLPFSTGVIGEALPVDVIVRALPDCLTSLAENRWLDAAQGIMTTDTHPKAYSKILHYEGQQITVTGIAKGAGMICPNMATMLSFIATDAKIDEGSLTHCLQSAVNDSFNRITVDGDTSTNDACVCIATGRSGAPEIKQGTPLYQAFLQTLTEVCVALAQALIKDAEGATKFITIEVRSGRNEQECRQVAYTVAHSPLVKTAMFASDPNWGRILAAVGRAPVEGLCLARIRIDLGGICIVRDGGRAPGYQESLGQQIMNRKEIILRITLNQGDANFTLWTSDLSHEYVRINAEYRS